MKTSRPMREIECHDYFLSATASKIWRNNDMEGQNQMLICLTTVHKEAFFSRLIYKRMNFPGSSFRDLAESAFLTTWEAFNKNGKDGKIVFKEAHYTGYFYKAFKNNYLKQFGKDLRNKNAEKEFIEQQSIGDENAAESEAARNIFSPRTQKALDKVSQGCKKLLLWRHVDNLSYDEIAAKKNVTRGACIKMVSRCGKRFLQCWWNYN